MQNAIGTVGETVFATLISKLDPRANRPLFRAQFLGDKWPVADFFVELEGIAGSIPYFFVQVKTTAQGFTKRENRLKVSVSQNQIDLLASHPAPTYVAGIDYNEDDGWLLAVTGRTRSTLPSLPTTFPINAAHRRILYDEVRQYWTSQSLNPLSSAFVTRNWK